MIRVVRVGNRGDGFGDMDEVVNKKVKGARPHMIDQNTFYTGLDTSF